MTKKWIPSFIQWRYDLYCAEYIDLFGSIPFFLSYLKGRLLNKSPNIVYVFANKRNIGDFISHLGVKHIVGQEGPFMLCSPVGKMLYKSHINSLKKYSPDTHLVIGGGGLLQGVFTDFWTTVLASGLRYSLVGVGINKMSGRTNLSDDLLSDIIINADIVSIRDQLTFDEISNHRSDIKINVCPSVNYVKSIKHSLVTKPQQRLLHMIHPSDLRLAGIDKIELTDVVKTIAMKLNLHYEEFSNMGNDHLQALELVNSSSLVITSRLHGAIMSYALETPFIAIYCDDKVQSFIETHTNNIGIKAAEIHQLYDLAAHKSVTELDDSKLDNNLELGKLLSLSEIVNASSDG